MLDMKRVQMWRLGDQCSNARVILVDHCRGSIATELYVHEWNMLAIYRPQSLRTVLVASCVVDVHHTVPVTPTRTLPLERVNCNDTIKALRYSNLCSTTDIYLHVSLLQCRTYVW